MPVQPRTIPVTNVFNSVLADVKDALNNIPGDALVPGSVDTAQLADGAVTTPKLDDEAVTNAKTKLSTGVKIWGTPGVTNDPSWIAFTDRDGNRTGYVGKGSTTTSDMLLVTDGVDALVRLQNQSAPGVWQDLMTLSSSSMYLPKGRIQFPATQNPSSDPNCLDDYEEGTWTPTVTCVTPGNLSVTYVSRGGTYTKIGNLVYLYCALNYTPTHTTASGDFLISGLPFPCTTEPAFPVSYLSGTTAPADTGLVARRSSADTSMLRIARMPTTTMQISEFTSGGGKILILSGVYQV